MTIHGTITPSAQRTADMRGGAAIRAHRSSNRGGRGHEVDVPIRRFVLAKCDHALNAGELHYDDDLAEIYARALLADPGTLAALTEMPDHLVAERLAVPLEQITLARIELTLGTTD